MTLSTRGVLKPFLVVVCVAIAAMWVYAFGFSSKESVNKIEDSLWQQKSELFCAQAETVRMSLADTRKIEDSGPNALEERAVIVDKATDTLELAIDQISRLKITGEKGSVIAPRWIDDYRTYISDRREYADLLRQRINRPFAETQIEGLPLSEKISTFAADNRMPSCKAPVDLSV